MPTWEETQTYMRASYVLVVDEPKWIGLAWSFKSADGTEDVVQRERVEQVQAFGEPHLLVLADVAPAGEVAAEQAIGALRHNMSIAIGAIAIADDTFVVRAVVPLETLTWPVLDRTLRQVAHEAARLREVGKAPLAS
jgi:hypothetical protein